MRKTCMRRAIHIIPDTRKSPGLEDFRRQFDCLYHCIRAHITLVFPFDLPISDDDLILHCQRCSEGLRAFSVSVQSPHFSADDHLWLPVEYSDPLAELTRRLHSGPLASLLTARRSNTHHITIARPPLPQTIDDDIRKYQSTFPTTLAITSFTLESILPDEKSLETGIFQLPP